jgi:hypothetical protein
MRLLALVDEITAHAKDLRRRAEDLEAALDAIAATLPELPRGTTPPPSGEPGLDELLAAASSGPAPRAGRRARRAQRPSGAPDAGLPAPVTESARLVAVEMAVGGHTRDEVSQRLQRAYGIADSRSILDDVFGPGTDGSTRMPWS